MAKGLGHQALFLWPVTFPAVGSGHISLGCAASQQLLEGRCSTMPLLRDGTPFSTPVVWFVRDWPEMLTACLALYHGNGSAGYITNLDRSGRMKEVPT